MPNQFTQAERNAIADFYKTNSAILCAAGSTATKSIDVAINAVAYKPVIYFARSASRQRVIASNQRAIKPAINKANAVIYL